MKRRDFIKSTAIGLGLITVPLMVRADPDEIDWSKVDLSEQAIEDILVEIEKKSDYFTSTYDWFIRPAPSQPFKWTHKP